MVHEEKIDYLLLDIRELEKKVADMREAEIYPVSFFSRSFELTHKILTDLHKLEAAQLEDLSRQMEAHRSRLSATVDLQKTAIPSTPEADRKTDIEPAEEVRQTTTTEQKSVVNKASVSLNEIIEKKNLSDFRKAFSLNDRFRFRRELFGGDEGRMNHAISELNEIHSYEDSVSFLHHELHWNIEDEAVADFLKLIEKRFL